MVATRDAIAADGPPVDAYDRFADALQRSDFAAWLSPSDLDRLLSIAQVRSYPNGAALAAQGGITDRLFVILSGGAKESHLTPEGREIILDLRGPGDLVAGATVLDGRPRTTTATALGALHALMITGSDYRGLVGDSPTAQSALTRLIAGRMLGLEQDLVVHSTADATARIAYRLEQLAERWGTPLAHGSIRIDLPLTQGELASWAWVSREATVKALSQFRRRGAIRTRRRRIDILDLDGLRAFGPSGAHRTRSLRPA